MQKMKTIWTSYQVIDSVFIGILWKPEAFKSNNPGYIRGKPTHNLSTPERVEVVSLKFFNTSGVVKLTCTITMDKTMDIRLKSLRHL